MKFQIHRTDFLQLISKVQNIIPVKPALPILTNILIQTEHDQIIVTVSDLTVSMRAFCNAMVTEEGSVALPAKHLFQLVRELTTPEIMMETSANELATLHAGSSHFRLQGTRAAEFPLMPDLSSGVQLSFKTGSLKNLLIRTVFAAGRNDERAIINGVSLQKLNQWAVFTATNGKKMARNRIELDLQNSKGVETMSSYIIPVKAVEEMVRILNDDEEVVTLSLTSEKVSLETSSTLLIAKLISGVYPDLGKIIPQKTANSIRLHREEMMTLLRQICLFTSEDSTLARFSFSEGMLHLSASDPKNGEGVVSIPVNYSGPKLEMGLNPQAVLDVLRHTNKEETVDLEVSDPYIPSLITDSSEAEFVVMPMKLEDAVC